MTRDLKNPGCGGSRGFEGIYCSNRFKKKTEVPRKVDDWMVKPCQTLSFTHRFPWMHTYSFRFLAQFSSSFNPELMLAKLKSCKIHMIAPYCFVVLGNPKCCWLKQYYFACRSSLFGDILCFFAASNKHWKVRRVSTGYPVVQTGVLYLPHQQVPWKKHIDVITMGIYKDL